MGGVGVNNVSLLAPCRFSLASASFCQWAWINQAHVRGPNEMRLGPYYFWYQPLMTRP